MNNNENKIIYKKICILMPTYNRSHFVPLIINNLERQIYPKDKLTLIIDDDGEKPLLDNIDKFEKQISPIKLVYLRNNKKRTIGEKRNNLIKNAKKIVGNKGICVNMDDDDIYFDDYIEYSYLSMIKNKYRIVGSNKMIFCFPHKGFWMSAISCQAKRQIHEATMMYTIDYVYCMGAFTKSSRGEGTKMIDGSAEKQIGNINCCMVCLVHKKNTVDKEQFWEERLRINKQIDPGFQKLITDCIKNSK